MRSAIRQQLTTNDKEIIRQNLLKLLSHKERIVRYDYLPVRGTQYLESGLAMEKGKRPVWSRL